jgi:SAM-dependent methyltransferase
MSSRRFDSKLGEDYKLFKLASPHYDEFQDAVGGLVRVLCIPIKDSRIDVLEIGCGTGLTTQRLLAADMRNHITAVDNEPMMVKYMRREFEKELASGRHGVIEADGLDYLRDLDTASFDIFASALMIHNFDDRYRDDFLKETYRVLKRGGWFVNGDKIAHDDDAEHNSNLEWQLAQLEVFDTIGRPELRTEWIEHYRIDNQPGTILREGRFRDQLQEIGFVDVMKTYRQRMEAVYAARKPGFRKL